MAQGHTIQKQSENISRRQYRFEQTYRQRLKYPLQLNINTITVTQYSASDIVIEEDIQVKPYAGKASEEETDPDRSIEHSFDDKFIADGGVPSPQ